MPAPLKTAAAIAARRHPKGIVAGPVWIAFPSRKARTALLRLEPRARGELIAVALEWIAERKHGG